MAKLAPFEFVSEMTRPTLRCICKDMFLKSDFEYFHPPEGETKFQDICENYFRSYDKCSLCNHRFSVNKMNMSDLYKGNYATSTYGVGIRETFEKIISLPASRSDNEGRIKYLKDFASIHFSDILGIRLLDVGSGLGVFPYVAKRTGWLCTAVDPDPTAVKHMVEFIGIDVVHGDFLNVRNIGKFDLITFNKVLEHVSDPIAMLIKAKEYLAADGAIYIELPDGELAEADGAHREEFFLEHLHVFSLISACTLGGKAGLRTYKAERLREPSGKYTIRVILVP